MIPRMLNTFLNLIHNGIYLPSRSPGSPVAEIGIGTLAWFGGSKLTNSFTLILFFSSISLFPFAFRKDFKYQNYLIIHIFMRNFTLLLLKHSFNRLFMGLVFLYIRSSFKVQN